MALLPQLIKTSNPQTPFEFEKGRYLPVNEPINPNQDIGIAGGGAVKVVDHGTAEQLREIVINNISKTNRDNLLTFIQHSTVNYSEHTCTFKDEDAVDHTIRIWKTEGLDFPRVRGGNYNIRLLLRDEI